MGPSRGGDRVADRSPRRPTMRRGDRLTIVGMHRHTTTDPPADRRHRARRRIRPRRRGRLVRRGRRLAAVDGDDRTRRRAARRCCTTSSSSTGRPASSSAPRIALGDADGTVTEASRRHADRRPGERTGRSRRAVEHRQRHQDVRRRRRAAARRRGSHRPRRRHRPLPALPGRRRTGSRPASSSSTPAGSASTSTSPRSSPTPARRGRRPS